MLHLVAIPNNNGHRHRHFLEPRADIDNHASLGPGVFSLRCAHESSITMLLELLWQGPASQYTQRLQSALRKS